MKVHFWGTRGSLPASLTYDVVREKIRKALKMAREYDLGTDEKIDRFIDDILPFSVKGSFGGNTSCVELKNGPEYVICDAGTGLRDLSNYILKFGLPGSADNPGVFNIFLSHLHWDHVQGFPFFMPAYLPGNTINFYGFHQEMEKVLYSQQDYPDFPVSLKTTKSIKNFNILEPEKLYRIGGLTVFGMKQNHPGDSYGYCFTADGKKIVYSTDSEHKGESDREGYPLLNLFRDADLMVFDAQYSFIEASHIKEDWGHSSNLIAVELSIRAGVKHLCLFHNEPTRSDPDLEEMLNLTKEYVDIYSPGYRLEIDIA